MCPANRASGIGAAPRKSWARRWPRPTRPGGSEEKGGWARVSLGDLRTERVLQKLWWGSPKSDREGRQGKKVPERGQTALGIRQ